MRDHLFFRDPLAHDGTDVWRRGFFRCFFRRNQSNDQFGRLEILHGVGPIPRRCQPFLQNNDVLCFCDRWDQRAVFYLLVGGTTRMGVASILDSKKVLRGQVVYLWKQSQKRESPFIHNTYGVYAIKPDMAVQLDLFWDMPEDTYDGRKVYELAAQGDEEAAELIDKMYEYLARAVYNIQYVYDP